MILAVVFSIACCRACVAEPKPTSALSFWNCFNCETQHNEVCDYNRPKSELLNMTKQFTFSFVEKKKLWSSCGKTAIILSYVLFWIYVAEPINIWKEAIIKQPQPKHEPTSVPFSRMHLYKLCNWRQPIGPETCYSAEGFGSQRGECSHTSIDNSVYLPC